MELPIKVLLIDDDPGYSKSLIGDARGNNIHIIHDDNWETGFEKLKEDFGIQFLILDGKCLLDEDQKEPKNNFLNKVLPDLKVYEAQAKRHLPFCINTGYLDQFEENWENTCKIFGKENNNQPLFDHITEKVKNTWLYDLKLRYPSPFLSFNPSIIDPKHLYKLNILLEVLEGKRKIEKNIFETVRELLEEIYISLEKNYNHFPDKAFFHRGDRPNLKYCELYMSGRIVKTHNEEEFKPIYITPDHIGWCFSYVSSVSSIFAHGGYTHAYTENILKSTIFSLFEIFSWLPNYIKTNYNT